MLSSRLSSITAIGGSAFTRGELTIMGGALLAGTFVSYLLLSDFTLTSSFSAKGQPIAEIVSLENNVKRRPSDIPLWSNVGKSQAIYQKDQIYTDAKSRVRVSFGKAGEIDVEENALVVVDQNDEQANLNVEGGAIVARVSAENKNGLEISVGGTKTLLKATNGSDASALIGRDENGKTRVSVIEGSATLGMNGKSLTINKNQEASLDSKSDPVVTNLPSLTLHSPNNGTGVNAAGQSVQLSWDGIKDVSKYRVQVAKDVSFKSLTNEQTVQGTSTLVTPTSEGDYFWRVGVQQGNGTWV